MHDEDEDLLKNNFTSDDDADTDADGIFDDEIPDDFNEEEKDPESGEM